MWGRGMGEGTVYKFRGKSKVFPGGARVNGRVLLSVLGIVQFTRQKLGFVISLMAMF